MRVRVVVSSVVEELAKIVSNAGGGRDVETHEFVDEGFRCVVSLLGDDEIVCLNEDGDREVAAKVVVE